MDTILVVNSVLLWLAVLLNLLLTFGLVRRLNADHQSITRSHQVGLKAGELAPDFSALTIDGETVTLATYAGRKVVFLFISIHCEPCHEKLPNFELLGPKAARAGVELVLVSSNEMEETLPFVEKEHIHLPILVAPLKNNAFMEDYKSTSTPSYCFIDEQSKVQSSGYPSLEWGGWKALAELWNGEAISLPDDVY